MRSLMISIVCLLAAPALVSAQLLTNGDIETNATGQFGGIGNWGPNGGWAAHSGFVKPNNGSLGLNFGFMSAQTTETVGQKSSALFETGKTYTFSSWANTGGNPEGEIVYQIGYDDGAGAFVVLNTLPYNIDNQESWTSLAGVAYSTSAAGPEIGKTVWVRLGDGVAGDPGRGDVWFDNLSLVVTPEPTSLVLLGLAAVGLLRRR